MSQPTPARRPQWRTDLEGLRVIAVVLVAVYHVWAGRVSGGVDVFIMLSGFFVGGSLWRRFAADKPPRPVEYVTRHLRRLLPAAIVVLAATAIGTVLILPQTRWSAATGETFASLLFFENWQLIASGMEYGAADPNQSAWQHFWSISVQAQLFLAVPACLAVVWWFTRSQTAQRRRRAMAIALSGLASGSFALAVWQMNDAPAVGYLSTATRAWEFLVGLLLAAGLAAWRPTRWGWALASWPAMAALLLTGLIIDGGTAFPGVWALLPVGAAAVIVIAGAGESRWGISRLLSASWFAACGKYAYGFYLWHWPILILSTAWRGRTPGWKVGVAILVASAVLAVLTYHLVEKPMRATSDQIRSKRARFGRQSLAGVLAACAVCLLATLPAWGAYLDRQRDVASQAGQDFVEYPGALAISDPAVFGDFEERPPIPGVESVASDTSQIVADGCVAKSGVVVPPECEYAYGENARVALFGASHSEQLFEILQVLGQEQGWTLVPIVKPSCPQTLPTDATTSECSQWATNALRALDDGDFDLIVTTATRPNPEGGDHTPESYIGVFERIRQQALVLAIRDNAAFPVDMVECFASGADCTYSLAELFSPQFPSPDLVRMDVMTVDTNDLVCPMQECAPVVGNRFVFRDRSHLTRTYVESMKEAAAERWKVVLKEAEVPFVR